VTALFRDPAHGGLEIWPPAGDLSPEFVAFHTRRAHRLRLDAVRASIRRLLRIFGRLSSRCS
jgi:hypothetical protein